MWRTCSTVWIGRLNFQIRDTDAKHRRFCASQSTIASLYIYISCKKILVFFVYFEIIYSIIDLNIFKKIWNIYQHIQFTYCTIYDSYTIYACRDQPHKYWNLHFKFWLVETIHHQILVQHINVLIVCIIFFLWIFFS
jgi:hypothetical protein